MKLRLESDNWDYGTIGDIVEIDKGFHKELYTVGDVYKIKIWTFDHKQQIIDCMVVNKKDEYIEGVRVPFFMGIGELWDYDEVLSKVNDHSEFKLGNKCGSLIFKDS